MICIDNLSPEDLLVLTNAIAITLTKDKNSDQINVLGNFIVGIGCLLLTVAAQQQLLESLKQNQTKQTQKNQTQTKQTQTNQDTNNIKK